MEKNTANLIALTNHVAELNRLGELTAGLVVNARHNGASWEQIGKTLGVTRQRAHQIYSPICRDERATRYAAAEARNTSQDHNYTPEENNEADKALAAMQAIAARPDDELQQHHEAAAKFLDGKTPAKSSKAPKRKAAAKYTETRDGYVIPGASENDTAVPGTGKGPHQCPGCASTNHKGAKADEAYFNHDCEPTKYDTPAIYALMHSVPR